MSALSVPFVTPEEYLEIERKAEFKSEYFSGQMFAMAGASRRHNVISGNIIRRLGNGLEGRLCETYPGDMKVLVSATGLFTYPDVTVVCGEPTLLDQNGDVLLNPSVVVEVLSDSTEAYDPGTKFALYQRLESLREYVLVSQHMPRIEKYLRQSGGNWLYSPVEGLESEVMLDSLGCSLPLAEIYERVTFPLAKSGREEAGTMGAGGHML